MNKTLREHADQIIREAIDAVQPDAAVRRALEGRQFPGKVLLVAAGKAAWQMAKAASDFLGSRIDKGVVVTKYDHVLGPIANFDCYEAGHPVPDEPRRNAGKFSYDRKLFHCISDNFSYRYFLTCGRL